MGWMMSLNWYCTAKSISLHPTISRLAIGCNSRNNWAVRLLVSGGAGYIGSHTAKALIESGHQVVVVDNLSTGFRDALPPDAEFVFGDVRDEGLLTQILQSRKIDGVLHFAAKLIVPESVQYPLEYYDNNILGTIRLLSACRTAGIKKFVFSSTAAVYGDGLARPLLETDVIQPINPYGHSKQMAETIIQDYQRSIPDFRFVILRYFNVAGAARDGKNGQRTKNSTHLISVACKVLTKKLDRLQIFGQDYPTADGTCIRDYIHVEDLASAHVAALNALAQKYAGGVLNCGYGRGASVREVVEVLKRVSGQTFATETAQRRPGDAAFLVADVTKLYRELQWTPRHASLEEICQSALKWESSLPPA